MQGRKLNSILARKQEILVDASLIVKISFFVLLKNVFHMITKKIISRCQFLRKILYRLKVPSNTVFALMAVALFADHQISGAEYILANKIALIKKQQKLKKSFFFLKKLTS